MSKNTKTNGKGLDTLAVLAAPVLNIQEIVSALGDAGEEALYEEMKALFEEASVLTAAADTKAQAVLDRLGELRAVVEGVQKNEDALNARVMAAISHNIDEVQRSDAYVAKVSLEVFKKGNARELRDAMEKAVTERVVALFADEYAKIAARQADAEPLKQEIAEIEAIKAGGTDEAARLRLEAKELRRKAVEIGKQLKGE